MGTDAPVPEGYATTLEALYQRRRFGMRPGLEVIRALLGGLGDPQRAYRSVHVAGSKGKGSVAALTAAILTASGRRTGLFTSPHLRSYRERIQIDRVPIPPTAVVAGLRTIDALATGLERSGTIDRAPTFFEVTTALAFDWFRTEGIDAAVVEVGLGGRLDATNVVDAPVAVVTTIELEHTEILGPTLHDIAREKAGIFHRGQVGIVGEEKPEPARELDRVAATEAVPLWHLGAEITVGERTLSEKGQRFDVTLPSRTVAKLALPLHGTFQATNAALAIAAADRFVAAAGGSLSDAMIRKGLRSVVWRGRLERFERRPDLYLDVAHTPESAQALARSLAEIAPFADPADNVVVFGCLADKRVGPILEAFVPLAHTLVVVRAPSDRAAEPAEIRRIALGRFRKIVLAPDLPTALAVARAAAGDDGFALVTGSDYVVGAALAALEGVPSGEPDLSDPGREPATPPGGQAVP